MKQIVLAGCSMTADYVSFRNDLDAEYTVIDPKTKQHVTVYWEYKTPHPTPVDLIANHYNFKSINLSSIGAGNKQILERLIDYVINNHSKIGLVIACWTSVNRMDVRVPYGNGWRSMLYHDYEDNETNAYQVGTDNYPLWKAMLDIGALTVEQDIDSTLRQSIILDAVCNSYGIECVQATSINSTQIINNAKCFIESEYYDKIVKTNFFGWPMLYALGGKALFEHKEDDFITQYDRHPNSKCHENAANKLIKFIDERNII